MKSKLLDSGDTNTYAIVLDENDSVKECVDHFVKSHRIRSAHLTAIGAFKKVKLGFFDIERREYIPTTFEEQVEVLTLSGDISTYQDEPVLHAHVVVGKKDGTAYGGHLLEGIVRPTLEVILTESPAHLVRKLNHDFGIPLIEMETGR